MSKFQKKSNSPTLKVKVIVDQISPIVQKNLKELNITRYFYIDISHGKNRSATSIYFYNKKDYALFKLKYGNLIKKIDIEGVVT